MLQVEYAVTFEIKLYMDDSGDKIGGCASLVTTTIGVPTLDYGNILGTLTVGSTSVDYIVGNLMSTTLSCELGFTEVQTSDGPICGTYHVLRFDYVESSSMPSISYTESR